MTYPFKGIGGVTVNKQTAGKRVWDINKDGVAQYGLYPDWIEDLTKVAGKDGDKILEDITRGAEAYLQMWERAEGIAPDSCRNADLRKTVSKVQSLIKPGMKTEKVMRKVGQPFTRSASTYGFCAKAPGQKNVTMTVTFSAARQGRLAAPGLTRRDRTCSRRELRPCRATTCGADDVAPRRRWPGPPCRTAYPARPW